MDAATPLVVSRWSRGGMSRPVPDELAALPVVTTLASDPREALAAALANHPGHDVLLLRADADWPVAALRRLLAGWHLPWDVLSPEDSDTLPLAGDSAAIDCHAWAQGDHAVWACDRFSTTCSLWRADAARTWLAQLANGTLAMGRLPCLFVGPPARSPSGATVVVADPDLAKPAVLHVLHCWGGGIERFTRDLANADTQRRHLFLVAHNDHDLPPFGRRLALYADLDAAPLREWPLAAPISATAIRSVEVEALLKALIPEWGIGAILVSSLIGHSLDVLRTGLPTAWCTHDAYPVWPLLHERRDARRVQLDRDCLQQTLDACDESWLFEQRDAGVWWSLRQAFLSALHQHSVTLVAPSEFARARLVAMAPELAAAPWQHIEHGIAPFSTLAGEFPQRTATTPLRVLVPGRINGDKGERLLAELVPVLPEGIELILLGCGHAGERFLGQRGVHLCKDYQRDELPAWIARLAPDLALLPSTVPETFSYVLSEMQALGLPVLCGNAGAYAERIGAGGWCVDGNAAAIAAKLQALRDHRSQLTQAPAAPPHANSLDRMARQWGEALRAAHPRVFLQAATPERVALADVRSDLNRKSRHIAALDTALQQQQCELDRRAEWAQRLEHELASNRKAARQLETSLADGQARLDATHDECRRPGETQLKRELDFEVERNSLKRQLEDAHRYYQQDTADLIHQRDVALLQRDEFDRRFARLMRNPWWKLGAPLRWLVHRLRSIRGTAAYRIRRWHQLHGRFRQSLRTRGWHGTWLRIQQLRQSHGQGVAITQSLTPDPSSLGDWHLTLPGDPVASIIIPAYGQLDFTLACLHSLAHCKDHTRFEVIVVDDASTDDSADRLAGIRGLRLHRNAENLGFIGACNAGAALARGEFLVFLNNDTVVQPGWLDALLATFAAHPGTGLAGSKLIYPDGRLQEAGGIVFSDASGWNYGRFDDPEHPAYNYVREVDYCSGAAVALPRALFESLDGFDNYYAPAYYEDTDLAMRIRAAGLKVRYQPRSVVVHYEGVTSGTDLSRGVKLHQVANQQKFLARWRETLRTQHPAPGTDIRRACEHRVRHRTLALDACTPTPDRDSGSLRMQALLSILREQGSAVSFFPENHAHDGRYTEALQQLGLAVWWQPWLGSIPRWLEENGPRFDLVIASRHYVLSPLLPLLRQFAPQARIVFDTVDLHHLREQREAELSGDAAQIRAAARTRDNELALIRQANCTWVVSEAERVLLAEELPEAPVEVVSNIHTVRGLGPDFEQRSGLLFVGGFRHPPNVDAALWLVDEILPRIHAVLPEVELHLVGGDAPEHVVRRGERPGVRFHGYVADLVELMDRTRVGVAPLRYGAGVKGKVNHALAHGQPMVATHCAVEGMHLVDGEDVLVAEDAEAFAAAVIRLYTDANLWRRLAAGGLVNTQRYFSVDAVRPVIQRLLSSLSRR